MTKIHLPVPDHGTGAPIRLSALAALVLLLVAGASRLGVAAAAPADTITLTSPNNTTIAESNDYPTQVQGHPWAMNGPDDFAGLTNITPPVVGGGIWTAQTTQQGASIFLVDPGMPSTFSYLGERNGHNYPIPTNPYTHLRIRLNSSVADRMVVYWFPPDSNGAPGNSNFYPTQPGWHIYDLDLAAPGSAGPPWTSQPTWAGLRLDPISNLGHAGAQLQIDWVRLTPATGSSAAITWTASGNSAVNLYLTTSPSGADEMQIAANLAPTSGGYTWNTAGMAPGTYYVHAVMGGASSYSGPLNINQAPVLTLTAPGPSSGEDYATAVLGAPWVMTNLAEFQTVAGISNFGFGPGYMQGTGYIQSGGHADPELWFLNGDAAHAIDAARYHYLSYRIYLQAPPNAVNGQYPQANYGPRELWSQIGQPTASQDTLSYAAWYNRWLSVAHDLRTTPLAPGPNNTGWTGNISTFRFDPHEEDGAFGSGSAPPFFRLGEFRLTADPTAQNGGKTTISWAPIKLNGGVTLYYNTSRAVGGTVIGTAPLSSGGYIWPVSGLANGTYWISAVAQDGLNTFGQVAFAPLVISGNRPCPPAFSDVPTSQPFYPYIRDLYCASIVEGYSNNTFHPYEQAARATLAQWIALKRNTPINAAGGPHFADVPSSDPFYPYVETAFNNGVISGYGDGTFRPYQMVTRGQASKMVVNGMSWAINTSGAPHFADVPSGNPFYGQIETMYNRGVISGYGCGGPGEPCDPQGRPYFRWGNPLTRAQLAKILDLAQP